MDTLFNRHFLMNSSIKQLFFAYKLNYYVLTTYMLHMLYLFMSINMCIQAQK